MWIHEPARDLTKFTFEPGRDAAPAWTRDSRRIAFGSDRSGSGPLNIYWQRADGTGPVQGLTDSPNNQTPSSFHPNGRYLAFNENRAASDSDLMILPLNGEEKTGWTPEKAEVFLSTPANESDPAFSPDGRWIAYQSNESGTPEIYVRPFQGAEGKWKVSTSGGVQPVWSLETNELLYVTSRQPRTIMVATYTGQGGVFRAQAARPWSPGTVVARKLRRIFDLHPDGQRVAIAKPLEEATEGRDKAVFVLNFFEELRRVAR